jgi:hypothetical protein
MFKRLHARWTLMVGGLVVLMTGAALGQSCNGNFCNYLVTGCTQTDTVVSELCCKDFDGDNVAHCVTCDRRQYVCGSGSFTFLVKGPAYNCTNPGSVCC